MKITIDDVKLNLLLEQKKEFIGRKVVFDSLASSVSLLITVLISDFKEFVGPFGDFLKILFLLIGLVFAIKSMFDIINSLKNSYDFNDLLNDINKLNEIESYHCLIVIKDTFNDFSNRYLIYDDEKWNCMFFINYKNSQAYPIDESFIINHLSNQLKINESKITIEKRNSKISCKYSVKDDVNKLYNHTLYYATINEFTNELKKDTFTIDGITYHWKTIHDLEIDESVKKHNMDIVEFVKETC